MTNIQKMIVKYLAGRNVTEYTLIGDVNVLAGDQVYTVNLYGDIMDAKTKKVVAKAEIEHDMRTLRSRKLPER